MLKRTAGTACEGSGASPSVTPRPGETWMGAHASHRCITDAESGVGIHVFWNGVTCYCGAHRCSEWLAAIAASQADLGRS